MKKRLDVKKMASPRSGYKKERVEMLKSGHVCGCFLPQLQKDFAEQKADLMAEQERKAWVKINHAGTLYKK